MNKQKKDFYAENDSPVPKTPELYQSLALAQPNKRQKKTGVALPDRQNVEAARDWCIENKK
ncbi:MAG: hypothetical protein ACOYKJ_04000 [Candidatus Howiella sp.]|jgi:hypothetical protein